MAKKTLILAFGPKGADKGDEGDMSSRDEEKAQAGKAFASAIKGGDGLEIAEAYEALKLACAGSAKGEDLEFPEGDDSDESESDGEEY